MRPNNPDWSIEQLKGYGTLSYGGVEISGEMTVTITDISDDDYPSLFAKLGEKPSVSTAELPKSPSMGRPSPLDP